MAGAQNRAPLQPDCGCAFSIGVELKRNSDFSSSSYFSLRFSFSVRGQIPADSVEVAFLSALFVGGNRRCLLHWHGYSASVDRTGAPAPSVVSSLFSDRASCHCPLCFS